MPQLAAFAPWSIIGWALILLVLLFGRWWWIAGLAGVLLILQISWVLPPRGSAAAAGPRPGSIAVRVMTINVKVGGADVPTIVALARSERIDLLSVEEGQPPLVAALQAALTGQLPNMMQSNPSYPSGTVMWSRWPITRIGAPGAEGVEILPVSLQVPGAVAVTVTGVHTISPGRGRIPGWDGDLRSLALDSSRTAGPHILLGDFNASRDHAPFRALLRTGLVDAADAVRLTPWAGVTWPADRPGLPAAVRIDHVLVTPTTIGVRKVRVAQVPGTDHRAVIAELDFAAAT